MEFASFMFGLFILTSTPGMNNIILFTISSKYGYKKCVPYLLGSILMGIIMTYGVVIGLNEIFKTYPVLKKIIAWVGFSFMIYLVFKIIHSNKSYQEDKEIKVLNFWHGIVVQIFNPKAWIGIITFTNLYIEIVEEFNTFHFIVFPVINNGMAAISNIMWIFSGVILSNFIRHKFWGKVFNYSMAVFLVYLGLSFILPYI